MGPLLARSQARRVDRGRMAGCFPGRREECPRKSQSTEPRRSGSDEARKEETCPAPSRPADGSRHAELTCRDARGSLLRYAQASRPGEQGEHGHQQPQPHSAVPHPPLSPKARGLRRGLLARRGDPEERPVRRGARDGSGGRMRGLRGYQSDWRTLSGLARSPSAPSRRRNRRCARRGLKSSQGGRGRGRGAVRGPRVPGYPGCAPTLRVAYAYVHRLTPGLQGACLRNVRPSALPAFQKLPRHALARPPSPLNRALPEVSGDCGASACLAEQALVTLTAAASELSHHRVEEGHALILFCKQKLFIVR